MIPGFIAPTLESVEAHLRDVQVQLNEVRARIEVLESEGRAGLQAGDEEIFRHLGACEERLLAPLISMETQVFRAISSVEYVLHKRTA